MLIPAPKRRRFRRSRPRSGALFVSVLLVAVLPAAWSARVVEGADRGNSPRGPNIIFILADDLGWGDLGCYGNRLVQTPELDRLAGQGTLFTQFYVCGSVCSPSRCAFFTGQYPARQRIHGHYATRSMNAARGMSQFLDPQVPNVARVLKSAGYATAHIGKWHLGSNSGGPDPAAYGFDFVGTGEREGANGPSGDRFFRARSTELFVDEALHFIREHREGPFYLQLWTLLTHATLNPTDAQMQRFARSSNPGIQHKSARTIYNASLFDLDQQIGRLLRELEALGLAERTVVVFSSDNGPEDIHIANAGHSGIGSAGPFRGRKRSLYEGGVRVPFLVRWPGQVRAGAVDDDSILAGVDLLPTLAGLAGATLPDTKLDGEDVGELWRGKPRARQQPLFWEWRFRIAGPIFHHSPQLAIRDGNWKLYMNPDRTRVELYDMPRDATQLNNLADRHPEVVERLAERLLAWRATLPDGPRDEGAGQASYPWPRSQSRP